MRTRGRESRPSLGLVLLGHIHWVIVGALVLYVVGSEGAGFYMLGPPVRPQDRVEERFTECMLLWMLSYMTIMMSSLALKKPIMTRRAVAWGTLAPVLLGFAVVGWVWWRGGFAQGQVGPPGLLRTYLRLVPAFPAVGGLATGAVVWLEARLLRPRIPLGRAGRYCKCGYDLTGNVSGSCPECGSKIEGGRVAIRPRG